MCNDKGFWDSMIPQQEIIITSLCAVLAMSIAKTWNVNKIYHNLICKTFVYGILN